MGGYTLEGWGTGVVVSVDVILINLRSIDLLFGDVK